jgi:transcription antitermination factor NusG
MIMAKKWYAVYTRPKWEKKVSYLLTSRKIENYCPLNKVQKQWSDRKKTAFEPLFNSYVFVHASNNDHSQIKQVDGIINFVHWLGNPAVIKDDEIEAIRKFLQEYQNIKLEKADVNINDKIRVISGALTDNEGHVIEINNRTVKIYLPSLGYHLLVEVEKTNIIVLNNFHTSRSLVS